jgi:hypothetical protein
MEMDLNDIPKMEPN